MRSDASVASGAKANMSTPALTNVEGNVGQARAENQIVAGKYLEKQLIGLTLLMSLSGVPVKKMDSHLKERITHGRDISFDRFMLHGCNHVVSSEKGPSKTHRFHIHLQGDRPSHQTCEDDKISLSCKARSRKRQLPSESGRSI